MVERLQINEPEGSGRGPGYGVFDDMEGPNEGVTPPSYDITTTLPTLNQTDIGVDTTDEGIPLALVGVCVLLGVFFVGLLYSYLSRSNKGEDKKVKSLLENIEIEVAPQSMKHQSLR